jgi:hypothetical protein
MKARDVYALTVRVGGVVCLVFAMFAAVHAVSSALDMPLPAKYSVSTDWLVAGIWFAFWLLLTFGAELLTRIAYGRAE